MSDLAQQPWRRPAPAHGVAAITKMKTMKTNGSHIIRSLWTRLAGWFKRDKCATNRAGGAPSPQPPKADT
jgi:hypothetical protein